MVGIATMDSRISETGLKPQLKRRGAKKSQRPKGITLSKKHDHLEFLQGAINRMASNLFFLKGWSVTLIAALFAMSAKDSNKLYVLLAYYPLFIFWLLDGYFLSQERRFRSLYDHVRNLQESQIDFSMDTSPFKSAEGNTWVEAFFSKTLFVYYGSMAAIMFVVMMLIE
jgi:hypothetical protein